ncbi:MULTISPECIES: GtrA family protein [Ralstonia]|uniref:GtrA family protein n=1 Tax=Ralstonia mojiangensis TaxID=2953895 RepID=A0ABT2L433_9RALS|nr:GtrA family protein [Ralstonia mojiangensis]MCO5413289.1 GtrA family protein [Ralstonia mojiangensis]MCT7297568.1 GtrA family protein [Ralstonia mojiangensis]MCT7310160.1 GtrA family protein [Ralstonia mojiangensis]
MRHAESSVMNALAGALPLPDRMLLIRLFRFGVSGVIATGVHVAIATALISGVSATQVTANGAAFVCANVCSYLLNALWSFSAKPARANFLRFYAVSLLGLALTLAISWCAQTLGLSYWIGLAGILSTVPPLTFVLHRFWTFR